jgi:uncharacterized membrane protein YqaE (UPF0057 family)
VGDAARLAGAGAGEKKDGAVDGLNAFLLPRVHVVEKAGHWRDSNINFICLRLCPFCTHCRDNFF